MRTNWEGECGIGHDDLLNLSTALQIQCILIGLVSASVRDLPPYGKYATIYIKGTE